MAGVSIVTNAPDGLALASASINLAASGNVIAGVANQIIRVYRMFFTITTAAGTVLFTDGVTSFSGAMTFGAGGGLTLPFDGTPWVTCGRGNPFTLTLSATGQTSGMVYFTQG